MSHRWAMAILIAVLILSVTPTYAEVAEIDPTQAPPPTLSSEEAARLATLQAIQLPILLSAPSPDDGVVLAAFFGPQTSSLALIGIADGAQTPVDPGAGELFPLTEAVWLDNQSVAYIAQRFDNEREQPVPILVTIDRATGAISTADLALPGFPVSLAPDGGRLLVELTPPEGGAGDGRQAVMRSRFDLAVPLQPTPAPRGRPFAGLGHRDPQLRAFASQAVSLAILDLRTGALNPLTTLPAGSELGSWAWSPNGRLALVHNRVAATDNRELTQFVLSNKATQDAMGRLDPAQNPFFQNNLIEVFDLAAPGSPPVAAVGAPALGRELIFNVEWSPDGQTLMAQMQRAAQIQGRRFPSFLFSDDTLLRFFDANLAPLGSFDRPELVGPFTSLARWASPDEVIFTAPRGLDAGAFYYNRRSGELRPLPLPEGAMNPFNWTTTRLSRQMIFPHSSLYTPHELYRISWEGQALARLTWANTEAEAVNQVRVNRVEFRLNNGARREGLLVQPKAAPFPPRNAPIVVWQQGGPGGWMGNQWGSNVEQPFNLLANFGAGVLIVPLQGRDNYGPAFVRELADGRNFGQVDIDEQAAIVRQMIDRGWTSRSKVGITGCSYGGYFTSQSIQRHPELYAAANTQCTWVELIVDFQVVGPLLNGFLQGGSPEDSAPEYVRDSPLYNAARVRTPTLIFHGTEDFQPLELMQSFHDQIAANGVPVRLVTFAGEGHGLRLPASQRVAAEEQITWFREYLGF